MSEKLHMPLKTLAKFLLVGVCNVYIFLFEYGIILLQFSRDLDNLQLIN